MLKHTRSLAVIVIASIAMLHCTTAHAGRPPKEEGGGGAGGAGGAGVKGGMDVKFVNGAARSGQLEVALGKLAAEKASSEEVKKLGQQMADDHAKANEELIALAKAKDIDIEKAQASGTKRAEGLTQKFSKLEGAEFDRAYIGVLLKEHERDVKQFQAASEKASDEEIKAFAAKTLPTLQHHLEMVREAQSKIGKPAGGAGAGGEGEGAARGGREQKRGRQDEGKSE